MAPMPISRTGLELGSIAPMRRSMAPRRLDNSPILIMILARAPLFIGLIDPPPSALNQMPA